MTACSLAAGLIAALVLLVTREDSRAATCWSALVPAYVPPAELAELVGRSPAPDIVVLNPASGAGTAEHPAYRRVVELAHERGTRVLGYVATGYGRRDAEAVEADVERYAAWYGVDGIFLDETASEGGRLPRYREFSRRARELTGGLVVVNPGRVPARGYFDLADVVVTFEGPAAEYAGALARMPSWLDGVPAAKIAHLVYGASAHQAAEVASRGARAGHLYVTSGTQPNPWRVIAPYLDDLQRSPQRCA